MSRSAPSTRRRPPLAASAVAAAAVAALVIGGVWVAGGLLTNDPGLSMALTAAWLGGLGLACLVAARRWRLWLSVLGTYAVVAGVVGGGLLYSSLVGRTVIEPVAAAVPASRAGTGAAGNVELARGAFRGIAHDTRGEAAIVRLAGGERVLQLLDLQTSPGPDLRVYLVAGRAGEGDHPGEHHDLGSLRGNRGTQQYAIPSGVDVARFGTALIWCRAFSVPFGAAETARS